MIDEIQPPTDNLYKFIAIGGIVFALVAFIFLLREQAVQRGRFIDAQVELLSAGYQDESGAPTDPTLRPAYYRREFAKRENGELLKLASGRFGYTIGISLSFSIVGFACWWWRVQRYEDAILRLTAAKLEREEREAK